MHPSFLFPHSFPSSHLLFFPTSNLSNYRNRNTNSHFNRRPPTEAPLLTETPTLFPTLTPELERPLYIIDLQLNYSSKAADVNQTITYPNWTGETLTNLILAVEPNLWSGGFSLKSLAVDDQPVTNYSIGNANQKLEIPLPQPLPPSGTVTISMNYGLILPQMQA